MTTETFDTSDLLNGDFAKELSKIKLIRNSLQNFIGVNNVIEEITKLVDSSDLVVFKNERARLLISKKKPVFTLAIDMKAFYSEYPEFKDYGIEGYDDIVVAGSKKSSKNKVLDKFNAIVNEDIIKPFTKYLISILRSKEFNKILIENGIKAKVEDDFSNSEFLLTTIFSTNVSFSNKVIYLEYGI